MRKVFFSFHYKNDNWRVLQVRNIGVVEDNPIVNDNKWEEIKRGGDKAIKQWIDDNLKGRSCTVVLVEEETAGKEWINYEIKKSWEDGKGVVGIYIHNLKDSNGKKSNKGNNPFYEVTLGEDKKKLSSIVECYNPPYQKSTNVYDWIKDNLEDIIEEAIKIREEY